MEFMRTKHAVKLIGVFRAVSNLTEDPAETSSNGIFQFLYFMTSSVATRGSLVVVPCDSRSVSAITADWYH
jgi:hypothetical protein